MGGGEVIWPSPKDIKSDEVKTSELKITKLGLAETRLEAYPVGSLFIVARSGNLKRTLPVAINRNPAAANQDLRDLVPFLAGMENYLQVMLKGFEGVILAALVKTGTTVQSLKYDEFERQPFPLPPLAKQRRIVGRVEELMALCDQLQAARAGERAVRDRLTTATLSRLTAPDQQPESAPQNARFALQSLPTLTAHAAHAAHAAQIKTLRQTILNLAVRGKLVAQDATDEPAAELLKRIGKEVAGKRQEMGLRSQDALPTVDPSDAPFELPDGWAWARFSEIGVFARGKSKHRPRNDKSLYADGTVPFVQTGDVARSAGVITTHSSVYNDKGLRQSMLWPAGTMCITIAANIADSGILTFDACFPDSVVGLVAA